MTSSARLRTVVAIILMWAASRGMLLASGWWGAAHRPSGRDLQSGNLQRSWQGPDLLEMWARWDSEWYLLIAERGYHLEDLLAGKRVAYEPADATGFFPLYPLLVRGVGAVLERLTPLRALETRTALLLAALLISNAALLGSLYMICDRPGGSGGAGSGLTGAGPPGRAGLFACAALLAFPPSLFLSAVYAESLLLFLTLLCFRHLGEGRWLAAAASGALASATKPAGLFLIVPAAIALWRVGTAGTPGRGKADAGRWSSLPRWLSLILYPAGAAAFSWHCLREFGDPLSWLRRQDRWRGAVTGPWRAFLRWAEDPQVHGAHGSTVELVFALLAILLLIHVLRKRPAAESSFAALVVLLPLCSTLWSFGRLSLQAFPLFIALGSWAARHRLASLAYFMPAAAGSALLMTWFAAWWWAG